MHTHDRYISPRRRDDVFRETTYFETTEKERRLPDILRTRWSNPRTSLREPSARTRKVKRKEVCLVFGFNFGGSFGRSGRRERGSVAHGVRQAETAAGVAGELQIRLDLDLHLENAPCSPFHSLSTRHVPPLPPIDPSAFRESRSQ